MFNFYEGLQDFRNFPLLGIQYNREVDWDKKSYQLIWYNWMSRHCFGSCTYACTVFL